MDLTCSHCFGDDEELYHTAKKRRWVLFYIDQAVQIERPQWDPVRNLALLKIIAIESNAGRDEKSPTFSLVSLSLRAPIPRSLSLS